MHVFFSAICSLCVKIFICCRVCRHDRYWDNGHSQEVMPHWHACMGILIIKLGIIDIEISGIGNIE